MDIARSGECIITISRSSDIWIVPPKTAAMISFSCMANGSIPICSSAVMENPRLASRIGNFCHEDVIFQSHECVEGNLLDSCFKVRLDWSGMAKEGYELQSTSPPI